MLCEFCVSLLSFPGYKHVSSTECTILIQILESVTRPKNAFNGLRVWVTLKPRKAPIPERAHERSNHKQLRMGGNNAENINLIG
jgi:hypothetical protein